jgi:hypothetical protein
MRLQPSNQYPLPAAVALKGSSDEKGWSLVDNKSPAAIATFQGF